MAYIGQTIDGGSYYNVNFAVGVGSSNRRDDVLLVQWMLHRVYSDHPALSRPESKPLQIDGWIGPKTIKWIRAFQSDMRRTGRPCAFDSRVDSARKAFGNVSQTPYTILWLNSVLLAVNPRIYSDPGLDPQIPVELLVALSTKSSAEGPFEEPHIAVPSSGGL